MYNEKLEQLIDAALADGELTEKEKQILFKKAQAMDIDLDEFEMVLDARLFKLQKEQSQAQVLSAPKSNKYGDVKKCPACGAIAETFKTTCSECGYTFTNVETNHTITKLFEMLNEAEEKSKEDPKTFIGGFGRLFADELAGSFGGTKDFRRKKAIIQNFPIPNAKEDILEFLAQAVPLSKVSFFEPDQDKKEMSKVWKSKCEQIIIKAKFSMKDDPKTLEEIMNYAKILKLKV